MRKIVVLLLFIITHITMVSSQMKLPADINRIMEKATSGKEITEEENARLEEWGKTMEQFYENPESQNELDVVQNETPVIKINNQCPEKTELSFEQLSREQYVELAQSLMKTYGSKTGDLQKLKLELEKSEKLTDGADMGAAFVMTGAGSASIYSIAWSAAQSPDDILTANNLGVALKDMGEYSKAVQVLLYANQLKPNIGLILCNLGWAYREAGDNANATIMFEKALSVAPKMSSPYLGLGLIAQCDNNHFKSEKYLRKALTQKYSSVGFAIMKQAQAAKSPSEQRGSQLRPLADDKGDTEGLYIPELPVFEGIGRMASQRQPLVRSITQLEARKTKLLSELLSLTERMKSMQTHTVKDTDNSVVFKRDFAREIMQLEDISELLFGDNSNYGSAQQQGTILIENSWNKQESLVQNITQKSEQLIPLYDEMPRLIQKMAECGDNKVCQKEVEAEIDQLKYKMEQIVFIICKEERNIMEMALVAESKKYKLISGAIKEAIPDYYAFTNPIIERIYSPTLNDYFNTFREYNTVLYLELNARSALVLQGYSEELNNMDCVEPEPPQPPEEISDPKLPQKGVKDCPLGENGIGGGIGVLSFELSCDHVKLSGGEGLLWSVKRDFNRHETTIWGGIGVKGEYGRGTLTAEATMGVEITVGQGDALKDLAFTSSVKAGVSGLAEAEISGRFALEGGPSVSSDANWKAPGIADILNY